MSLAGRARLVADRALDALGNFANDHGRLAEWQRDRFWAQARKRTSLVCVEGAAGVRYLVRPKDPHISQAIIRTGAFEPDKIARVLSLLRTEGISVDQLLDVGANIGTTSIEVLRLLPDIRAVAFEPEPDNYRILRMNLIANGLEDRVRTHQIALSDTTASLTFELSSYNPGDNRVRYGEPSHNVFGEERWHTIQVPALPLDDVQDLDVTDNTLIYMDVQGHEGQVLAGARRVLEQRPPLAMELWPYGLERADGLELFLDRHSGYQRIFDTTSDPPREISHQLLRPLAEHVAREPWGVAEILAVH